MRANLFQKRFALNKHEISFIAKMSTKILYIKAIKAIKFDCTLFRRWSMKVQHTMRPAPTYDEYVSQCHIKHAREWCGMEGPIWTRNRIFLPLCSFLRAVLLWLLCGCYRHEEYENSLNDINLRIQMWTETISCDQNLLKKYAKKMKFLHVTNDCIRSLFVESIRWPVFIGPAELSVAFGRTFTFDKAVQVRDSQSYSQSKTVSPTAGNVRFCRMRSSADKTVLKTNVLNARQFIINSPALTLQPDWLLLTLRSA